LLCIAGARLAPFFSLRKLFHHLSQMAPSPPNLDQPGLTAKKPTRKRKPATDPLRLHRAATRHVKASTLNISHLLKEQERLTATKDGPFSGPRLTPHGISFALRSTILGGGDDRWLPPPSYPTPPPRKPQTLSQGTTQSQPRANRRKATRSCAGPHHGPDRQPRSGFFNSSPSYSFTPARPYHPNDGDRHGERNDDDRDRPPPPPPPPNPPRGDLPHLQIRCQYSDHKGQCERIFTPTRGQFRFRLVRK